MELTIPKAELAKLLLVTQAIAERKSTMPILGNLLLKADKDTLSITGSDLEITALATGAAEVKTPGSITVSGKVFGEVVRELPDGPVQLKSANRERLEIKSASTSLKLVGVSADEYPVPAALSLPAKSRVPAPVLSEMINKTLYAVSLDEGRYTMNGVSLELFNESGKTGLRMVSTDGHRLALVSRPVEKLTLTSLGSSKSAASKAGARDHVIIPKKGLGEIRKILDLEQGKDIGLDVNEGFFVIETPSTKLVVRLIDGEFPDYSAVLPKEAGVKATTLSSGLSQALKRVALMVSDKNKGVRFDIADKTLKISSSSAELGEAQEELEVEYHGKPLTIGFNARYLLDVVASIGETQPFTMELLGETGPGKFYAESDEGYLAIVMPLRLD